MPEFETTFAVLVITAAFAYALGAIPFGLLVSRLAGLPDPRTIGSKNIGATNVLRSGSKPAALATVLLDGAKGLVAVVIGRLFVGEDAAQVAGLFAFLGHLYPVWLGFKGGKGVATLFGALFGLAPIVGLLAAATWLIAFFSFRISSLSALLTALLVPFAALLTGHGDKFAVLILISGLVIWKHRANIERLRDGTEPKVNWGSK